MLIFLQYIKKYILVWLCDKFLNVRNYFECMLLTQNLHSYISLGSHSRSLIKQDINCISKIRCFISENKFHLRIFRNIEKAKRKYTIHMQSSVRVKKKKGSYSPGLNSIYKLKMVFGVSLQYIIKDIVQLGNKFFYFLNIDSLFQCRFLFQNQTLICALVLYLN